MKTPFENKKTKRRMAKQLRVWIPQTLVLSLDAMAKKLNSDHSALARSALEAFVRNQAPVLDGLIGAHEAKRAARYVEAMAFAVNQIDRQLDLFRASEPRSLQDVYRRVVATAACQELRQQLADICRVVADIAATEAPNHAGFADIGSARATPQDDAEPSI